MAPLARPAAWALAAFLLAPGLARAQPEQDAQAAIAKLKGQYTPDAQKAAADPAAPADPAKYQASLAVLAGAKLDDNVLEKKESWAKDNVADLGPAITAASEAVRKLHHDYPSAVGDTFYGNGTMVNLEDTFKVLAGGDLQRGCVSHQNVTFNAVSKVLAGSSLEVHGLFAMRKITPHHAVIVFPKGADWKKTGVVFDGWIHQESAPDRMTYRFQDWYGLTSWKDGLE